MPTIGQFFTSATWVVKEGKQADFISAWSKFAEWTSRNGLGAGTGHLLQDAANPGSFLSFGPWDSREAMARWRDSSEFEAFFALARELCEDIQPRTLTLAAIVPSPT